MGGEIRVIIPLFNPVPGVHHWYHAIVEQNGKYYYATKYCTGEPTESAYVGWDPDPCNSDSWNLHNEFETLEEAKNWLKREYRDPITGDPWVDTEGSK